MLNKCLKLCLVLLLVVGIAVGVSLLPFSLSEKFKKVAEVVKSHIKGLANFGDDGKVNLDLSKTDSYTHNNLNIVLDKVDNVPKEGFFKYVHKGEKDTPLDVQNFFNGKKKLDGLDPALVEYCGCYFKTGFPHLLAVELLLHDKEQVPKTEENNNKNGDESKKGGDLKGVATGGEGGNNNEGGEGKTPPKNHKFFYVPGANNKWEKLPEGTDLGLKFEEVFNKLNTNFNDGGNQPPTGGNTPVNGGQNLGNNNGNGPNVLPTPPAQQPEPAPAPPAKNQPENANRNNLTGANGKGPASGEGETPAPNKEEKKENDEGASKEPPTTEANKGNEGARGGNTVASDTTGSGNRTDNPENVVATGNLNGEAPGNTGGGNGADNAQSTGRGAQGGEGNTGRDAPREEAPRPEGTGAPQVEGRDQQLSANAGDADAAGRQDTNGDQGSNQNNPGTSTGNTQVNSS